MPFVVTGGQLANLGRPQLTRPYPALALTGSITLDYHTIWRTQPQVRTVTGFLGRNIAQLGLHLYRRVSDTDRERVTDHPLAKLFGQPTPWTTRYRMINDLVLDLGIYDSAYLLKVIGEDRTPALVRLEPFKVRPVGDNPFVAEGFEYAGGRGPIRFPATQVVHFHGYNPSDYREGSSPIEALRTILAEEFHAAQFREQMWRNGARASGYIRRPAEAPRWSKEARARFGEQWQEQYSGDSALAGGTPILEDGMEWTSASVTPEQAQYLDARKLTREEVASAYYVPPSMLGILEHANYANIKEQHKILYQDTLGPWLTTITQEIDMQLLPDFPGTEGLYSEFNLAEKLRGSFEDQATQLQVSVGAPYMTRNEARARLNLPQIEGGDELITPLNVLVGGQANPRDSAPPLEGVEENPPAPAIEGDEEGGGKAHQVQIKARVGAAFTEQATKTLARYFSRQGQVISSRLGGRKAMRKATLDEVYEADRWTRELAAELFGLATRIASAAGKTTLVGLHLNADRYDVVRTLPWLQAHAERVAELLEAATAQQLADALAEDDSPAAVATLFASYATARAAEIADTEVTALSGFGTAEAVEKAGASERATKTWRTNSTHPRAAHAAMNGETVPMAEVFSNGARWPGDHVLPPEQRFGCRCEMDVALT